MTIDWNLAELAADIALGSYSNVTIQTDRVHALIIEDDNYVRLGLQGTADAEAFLLDAMAMVHRNDPLMGKTPDTFAADAEQIFWRIWPKLPPNKPLIFGGHSKGASEIEDLTFMFRRAGRIPLFMGAFEPAPVGDLMGELANQSGIATWLGVDVTKVDERDPVPDAEPPWSPLPHAMLCTALKWPGPRVLNVLDYHSMSAVYAVVKMINTGASVAP